MDFIFDNQRIYKFTRIASESCSDYANTPAEVFAICESIKTWNFNVEGIKPMEIGLEITNVTGNENGKDNDCFYGYYMAQDYDGMRNAISALSKEFAERVCALMTPTDKIRAKFVSTFYAPSCDKGKPITGSVRFWFTIFGEDKMDFLNRPYRPIKREYRFEFSINELSTESKIF